MCPGLTDVLSSCCMRMQSICIYWWYFHIQTCTVPSAVATMKPPLCGANISAFLGTWPHAKSLGSHATLLSRQTTRIAVMFLTTGDSHRIAMMKESQLWGSVQYEELECGMITAWYDMMGYGVIWYKNSIIPKNWKTFQPPLIVHAALACVCSFPCLLGWPSLGTSFDPPQVLVSNTWVLHHPCMTQNEVEPPISLANWSPLWKLRPPATSPGDCLGTSGVPSIKRSTRRAIASDAPVAVWVAIV